jgi:cytochrome P450
VEEVLRYDPPVQFTGRIAKEDMEVGGSILKKGQQSVLLLGSANRDEAQFPNADKFDITREGNQHIAFSHGIHFCVGAPLARVEGQIALETMARRVKGMQMLVDEPEYKENIVLRGLAALPVGFSEVLPA